MRASRLIFSLNLIALQGVTAQSATQCENYCISYQTDLINSNSVAGWVNGVPINVDAPGSAMSSQILEYMCDDGYTLDCLLTPCGGSFLAEDQIKWNLLLSWATVCNTRALYGDDYAIACWESEIATDCDYIPSTSI